MAQLEIYELRCEKEGCTARATWRLRTAAGTFHLYCRKDAGPALIEQTKKEAAQEKAQKPQAVRS